jgi:cytoskeletal protein CcmA (bactofilin family)
MTQHSRSLIGAQTRIEGSIAFAGTLQTDGHIEGDVTCQSDGDGVVVVGRSGHIAGSITARQVVVGGAVSGNVTAGDTIEVHDAARVSGDLSYRGLVVMPGSTIDGRLTPLAGAVPVPSPRSLALAPAAVPSEAAAGSGGLLRRPAALVAGLFLAALLAWFFWPKGMPREDSGAASAVPVESPTPVAPVVKAEPVERPPAVEPPPAVPAVIAPPAAVQAQAPVPPPASPVPVPASPPQQPAPPASERVTTIRGESADKAADIIYIVAQDAAVLARKKRQADGSGTTIELPAGAKKRLPVARDEILRVVDGERLEIFYQGKKVMPASFRGGAWLEFVPADAEGRR